MNETEFRVKFLQSLKRLNTNLENINKNLSLLVERGDDERKDKVQKVVEHSGINFSV